MRLLRPLFAITSFLLCLLSSPLISARPDSAELVDVEFIIKLLTLHTPTQVIVALIQNNSDKASFNFTPDNMRALKIAGATNDILRAMLDAKFSAEAKLVYETVQAGAALPVNTPPVTEQSATKQSAVPQPAVPQPPSTRPVAATSSAPSGDRGKASDSKDKESAALGPSSQDKSAVIRPTFAVPKLSVQPAAQIADSPNSACANIKHLPSLLGNPTEGQNRVAGCTDYMVANQAIKRVLVEITKVGQSLPCTDTSPNEFSQTVEVVRINFDEDKKYGSFYTETPALIGGQQVCLLEEFGDEDAFTGAPSPLAMNVIPAFKDMAPLGEALVGVDVNAASSASPQAVLLALGNFDLPLEHFSSFSKGDFTKKPLWVSGEIGLKGIAQPGVVSGAASVGYYASAVNATPDKIVQSVDVSMHLGWQIHSWSIPMETFDSGTGADLSKLAPPSTFATLSVIFGGGAISPLSVSQSNPQVFEATPLILQTLAPVSPAASFASACGQTSSSQCYVVFLPADRTHFYRSYDAGLRLKLYAKDLADNELRFPAMLNLTLGQNEYVTGGKFRSPVLHVGGTLPFPRLDSVYVFGNFDLGLTLQNGSGPQLELIPAPVTAGVTATSSSVYTISTTQPNRDRYEVGFGVDIFHLFSNHFAPNKQSKTQGEQQAAPE
jgi:hypothetical protein